MTTEVDKTTSIVANFISIALLDDMSLLLYLRYRLRLATDWRHHRTNLAPVSTRHLATIRSVKENFILSKFSMSRSFPEKPGV